jgi:hypothetical protein
VAARSFDRFEDATTSGEPPLDVVSRGSSRRPSARRRGISRHMEYYVLIA